MNEPRIYISLSGDEAETIIREMTAVLREHRSMLDMYAEDNAKQRQELNGLREQNARLLAKSTTTPEPEEEKEDDF